MALVETALLVINAANKIGMEITGIVDSDPERQGEELSGRIIGFPREIEGMHPDGAIITSLSHRDQIHKAIKHLEDNGIKIRQF